MGVVNTQLNKVTYYDPSTGEDSVQLTGSSATVTPIPLPTDGKYMMIAHCPGVNSSGSDQYHWFQIQAGDEGLAWQRGMGAYTFKSSGAVSSGEEADYILGPFESARFVCAATATGNFGGAVGDPVIKVKFTAAATAATQSADANEFPSADNPAGQANVTVFKLPQVE